MKDQTFLVTPNNIDPNKLIPELLGFFVKLANAKQALKNELKHQETTVLLAAITEGLAKIMADNSLIPKDVLKHLDELQVETGILKRDENCEDCPVSDICPDSDLNIKTHFDGTSPSADDPIH